MVEDVKIKTHHITIKQLTNTKVVKNALRRMSMLLVGLSLIIGFGVGGSFLILSSKQNKPDTVIYYKDYVIDNDGTLIYTNKHIDITV